MKQISFKGIKSGDHEAFCWDVDKETFYRITGKYPDKYDSSIIHNNQGLYRIYPNDILDYLGVDSSDDKTHEYILSINGE